jgi:molybdopterin molybdotransferase
VNQLTEFFKVVRFEEAQKLLRDNFPPLQTEKVELSRSLNRVLARDVLSHEDMPAFERSTVDGYAVRARDTFGSTESIPGFLTLKGEVLMGQEPGFSIEQGECAWVPTGAMLPSGADGVVMMEYTEKLGEDTVLISRPAGPYDNVIRIGEDARWGEVLFSQGSRLRAQDIGVLAALGITEVQVFSPMHVGIVSSGDEIVPIEEVPTVGQVRDVNSYTLAAALTNMGGIPCTYGIISDNRDLLSQGLEKALEENEVVLLSGGSSVGERDFSLEVLLSFPDSELLFHGVAARPGKPTLAVRIGERLVVGLPGHPVAAFMMFTVLCMPLLGPVPARQVRAVLNANVASQAGRDDFLRVELSDSGEGMVAAPVYGKSGLIRILSLADGFVHIPYEKQGFKAGESVLVTLF